jgi:hypothetical protein
MEAVDLCPGQKHRAILDALCGRLLIRLPSCRLTLKRICCPRNYLNNADKPQRADHGTSRLVCRAPSLHDRPPSSDQLLPLHHHS